MENGKHLFSYLSKIESTIMKAGKFHVLGVGDGKIKYGLPSKSKNIVTGVKHFILA